MSFRPRFSITNLIAAALTHMMEHGRLTIQDYKALCPNVNRRTL